MIVKSEPTDFEEIYAIINDGASAYRGIIPADRWHDPYMTAAELNGQIDDGVQFWIYRQDDAVLGVMGIQYKQKHGFRLLVEDEKNKLLRKYWTIPERQIETSVVLASADWEGLVTH